MKYVFPLILIGCFNPYSQPIPAHYAGEEPNTAPIQISSGESHNVQWNCSQDYVTEGSVWISCRFKNMNTNPINTCIDVRYIHQGLCTEENPSGIDTVVTKTVCSGDLNQGDSHERYVSFYNQKDHFDFPKLINTCGRDMTNYKMQTNGTDHR